jgi:hypothetical protein
MAMLEGTRNQPVLSPAARDDPTRLCRWLVMDDENWSPMPSCAVSNKNGVVFSSTDSAYHEDTDNDCWDSIANLNFDHEVIEKENKVKSESSSNKTLVRSGSFRRLTKSLGSSRAKRIKKSKKKLDALIKEEEVVL